MIEAVESLRILGELMFWALADLFLGVCWSLLLAGIILVLIKGPKDD